MALAKTNFRLQPTLNLDFDEGGNVVGLAVNLAYDVVEDGTVIASNTKSVGVWGALTATRRQQVNALYQTILSAAQVAR